MQSQRTRRPRLLLGLVCLVLYGVAGCQSSNPEPAPMPSDTTSAPSPTDEPSTSPSPTPPTMPAVAKGTSKKAAKAFVRHYFKTINYAAATGEVQHLRQLSSSRCESCQAIASNIAEIYSAGGSIDSKGWSLRTISAVPKQPDARPIFDLGVVQSREVVTPSEGADEQTFPGGKQPMTIYLKRTRDGWVITKLDRVT